MTGLLDDSPTTRIKVDWLLRKTLSTTFSSEFVVSKRFLVNVALIFVTFQVIYFCAGFGAGLYGLSALALNSILTELINDSLAAIGTLLNATIMPIMALHVYLALGLHQPDDSHSEITEEQT